MEILLGVHSLARYYRISGLANDLIGRIRSTQIPLPEIPSCISLAWKSLQQGPGQTGLDGNTRPGEEHCTQDQAEAVSSCIEQTIKSIPGKDRVIEAAFDLNPLKGQLARNLPRWELSVF